MKKMVICLLLALLCLLPCRTALAAETGSENNTTTPTADDPYHKGESDDNSDADDLQWYRDNAALLENNNIVGNALRSVSWSITGLVCKVANVAETLYTKTFGLIDITNYPQINDLLDTLRPVLLALTVLCCAGLGIMLLVQHEKRPPLLRNILLGIVAVSASAWLFSTANDLVIAFRDGILGGEEVNQSYELVESNLIDLIRIDKRGDINALNYKAGQGVIYGVGIASQDDMDSIDLCETLDWHTAKNGKNLYGWSTAFNNRVKYRLAHTADGDVARKNYDGLTSANIGNQFFYRYSFDFWSCLLQLLSLSLLFLALCYKNVRIAYELVVSRLLAFLFAADIGGGEKLKNTLLFVRDTYLTMCVCVLSVKLYEIRVGVKAPLGAGVVPVDVNRGVAQLAGTLQYLPLPGVDSDVFRLGIVGVHAPQRGEAQATGAFHLRHHGPQGIGMGFQQQGVIHILAPQVNEHTALGGQPCFKTQALESLQNPGCRPVCKAGGAVYPQKCRRLLGSIACVLLIHDMFSFHVVICQTAGNTKRQKSPGIHSVAAKPEGRSLRGRPGIPPPPPGPCRRHGTGGTHWKPPPAPGGGCRFSPG